MMIKYIFLLLLLLSAACNQPTTQQTETKEISKEAIPQKVPTPNQIQQKETPKAVKLSPAKPDYNTQSWTEVSTLDSSIVLDLRYATANNFVKEQMYECGRCFLRPQVARRIFRAHQLLQKKDLGLKMFDCYRPRPIQQKLWDKVPNASYVTPPWKGSMHNKGAAVDLTIVDAEGKELDMGTEFDYFGERGHHTFQDLPAEILANRRLLKETMASVGLSHIRTEWWHYSFKGQRYEIADWVWNCPAEN